MREFRRSRLRYERLDRFNRVQRHRDRTMAGQAFDRSGADMPYDSTSDHMSPREVQIHGMVTVACHHRAVDRWFVFTPTEHPFSQYVRVHHSSRSLARIRSPRVVTVLRIVASPEDPGLFQCADLTVVTLEARICLLRVVGIALTLLALLSPYSNTPYQVYITFLPIWAVSHRQVGRRRLRLRR